MLQDAVELELIGRRTGWQRQFFEHDNVVTPESLGLSFSDSSVYRRVARDDAVQSGT